MKNKVCLFGLFSLFLFFVIPMITHAGNGSIYVSGNAKYYPNKTFSVDIVANASAGNIMGIGGVVTSSNPSCVEIQSVNNVIFGSFNNASKFGYLDTNGNGFAGTQSIVRVNLKSVGQSCSANISLSQLTLSFTDGTNLKPSNNAKTINVLAPPSDNNNLSSLTVNNGSLNPGFSFDKTSYTVSVDEKVSSIVIGATAQDRNASVSGVGQKNLNFGDNNFSIVVKAESGATKTYNINVNRKDNRSNDNKLKSLTVNGGSLSPEFSSGTNNYNLSVPFEITKLDLSAVANDSKATVSINNPDLIAEKTTNVIINVKAENGSVNTYTIKVSRGKDPNKVLSTDNKLLSLIPSVGMLSPIFDSNKNNYYVYLPYEIDKISFGYDLSEKEYATIRTTGEEELVPDSDNYFSFVVTAEDGSENTYTVTVNRAKNHDGESSEDVMKKIAAAESSKNAKCDIDGKKSKSNIALIIGGIVIIVALGALSTYLFLQNQKLNGVKNKSKK